MELKGVKTGNEVEENRLSTCENSGNPSTSLEDERRTSLTRRLSEDKPKYGSFNVNDWSYSAGKSEVLEEEKSSFEESGNNNYRNRKPSLFFDNLALSVEENGVSIKNFSSDAPKNDRKNSNREFITESSDRHPFNYISIQRNIMDDEELNKKYGKPYQRDSIIKQITKCCSCNPISCITSLFPIFVWLPKYQFKQYILSDIIAGFTLAVLQIPQGMAYGLLASVDAIYGLYVSFFPVLIYCVMGTSKHISIGTFAVISIMLSNIVAKFETADDGPYTNIIKNLSNISTPADITTTSYFQNNNYYLPTKLEILLSASVVVGLWQIAMGILRLGILNIILSDQLISGFTTGAAIHVATSQLKDLFGIKIVRYSGLLQVIKTYIDIFKNLKYTNLATLSVSAVCLFTLAVVKDHINDRFRNKLIMPIPIDFVVIIIGTAVSYYGNFSSNYGVEVMNKIPTGLPTPQIPRTDLFTDLITDSFSVAIVVFAITLSMAKLFAKKHNYEINPNQELIALGSANIISSFFLCFPCGTSLSRSLVQERAGGKTQLASFISCLFLLFVLLYLAPLFSALPKCILAAIIIVALKGMFLQVKDFWKAWKISRLDAMVWMVAVIAVVLTSIDFGLLLGVCFTIFVVLIRIVIPNLVVLGNIPKTEIYLDVERYECKEIKNIKIYHYGGILCFLNREFFKNSLMKDIFEKSKKKIISLSDEKISSFAHRAITSVILDCSSISYLDMSAINTLLEIKNELTENGISLTFSNCPAFIYEVLEKSKFFEDSNIPHFFPSTHDAVLYCQNNFNIRL